MVEKIADGVDDAAERPAEPIKRLCNEIQLLDLCELEKCGHKQGLFCTSTELLNRFETITEDEIRPVDGFISDEIDEVNDDDFISVKSNILMSTDWNDSIDDADGEDWDNLPDDMYDLEQVDE